MNECSLSTMLLSTAAVEMQKEQIINRKKTMHETSISSDHCLHIPFRSSFPFAQPLSRGKSMQI
jgi:hypothetical protein